MFHAKGLLVNVDCHLCHDLVRKMVTVPATVAATAVAIKDSDMRSRLAQLKDATLDCDYGSLENLAIQARFENLTNIQTGSHSNSSLRPPSLGRHMLHKAGML